MATVRSNGDQIGQELEATIASIDFTQQGAERNLADELIEIAWSENYELATVGKDPDGADWKANETKYAKHKAKKYHVDRPGELGGQMCSEESMRGKPDIAPDLIDLVYGTGDRPPANSRFGTPLRESERQATDQEKAEYFVASGRRFYELTDAIEEKLTETAGDVIADNLTAEGW